MTQQGEAQYANKTGGHIHTLSLIILTSSCTLYLHFVYSCPVCICILVVFLFLYCVFIQGGFRAQPDLKGIDVHQYANKTGGLSVDTSIVIMD